jgi:hypothetical protein
MAQRDRLVRQALKERFVVTLKSGEAFDVLLLAVDDKTIRATNAFALGEGTRVAVDGELYLPREGIAYMQRPGSGA